MDVIFFFYVTEVHKLQMFGKIFMKIFRLKRSGSGRMLNSKELSDIYSSLNIYGIMKCRRLRRPNVGETSYVCTREL